MRLLLAWFWMCLILASVAWYAFLLFYVGIRGGREIISLRGALSHRPESSEESRALEP
jgi:hypothetical protein